MNRLKRYQRKWFFLSLTGVAVLSIANLTDGAIRECEFPNIQTSLPGACLDGTLVCTPSNPMIGDFNNNGKLDAGDLVIMQRAVLGLN